MGTGVWWEPCWHAELPGSGVLIVRDTRFDFSEATVFNELMSNITVGMTRF